MTMCLRPARKVLLALGHESCIPFGVSGEFPCTVVACAHTVVVCVVVGVGGGPLINTGHSKLFPLVFKDDMTHTVVLYPYTVVI